MWQNNNVVGFKPLTGSADIRPCYLTTAEDKAASWSCHLCRRPYHFGAGLASIFDSVPDVRYFAGTTDAEYFGANLAKVYRYILLLALSVETIAILIYLIAG